MRIVNLYADPVTDLELIIYESVAGAVTVCVNRAGVCVLRARVPVAKPRADDDVTVDIGGTPSTATPRSP